MGKRNKHRQLTEDDYSGHLAELMFGEATQETRAAIKTRTKPRR